MATNPNTPDAKIAANRARVSGGAPIVFPSDIQTLVNNRVKISIHEYIRGNPLTPGNLSPTPVYTLVLPLPSGLRDNSTLSYDKIATGLIGGSLDAGGNFNTDKLLAGITEAGVRMGGASISAVAGVADSYWGTGGNVQSAADTAKKVAGMGMSYASNPNLALAFSGVTLRDHNFQWKLMAQSKQESDTIKNIINVLKRSVLPRKYNGANFAFAYPYIFKFDFTPNDMLKISDLGCFVESMSINYEGDGQVAFYKDGTAPVSVDISLSLKERSVLTAESYDGDSAHLLTGR